MSLEKSLTNRKKKKNLNTYAVFNFVVSYINLYNVSLT